MTKEISLYRKYRPQNFDDVIGQEHVVAALEGAIKNNKVAHAYLMYGTRGIGKTTLARIFANALGTKKEDLYEIDAASYTGVDNIRELNASVKALPYQSTYKVYIIDEVHMLSKSAFNALLKTIEEPPQHVIFILATTELDKVIDTIISRCQVFTLKTPNLETLRTLIERVAKEEKLELTKEAVTTIALLGDGSFRDTLGILQKIMTVSSDNKLSDEEVQKITGSPSTSLLQKLITALGKGDGNTAMTAIYESDQSGIDARTLTLQLIHYARSLLLLRFAPDLKASITDDLGSDMTEFLAGLRGKEGIHVNASLLTKLLEASYMIQRSHTPYLPLELAVSSHLSSIHTS